MDRRSALQNIYAKIPKIECKGLCYDSCGPIGCSTAERRHLLIETGYDFSSDLAMSKINEIALGGSGMCPLLKNNRCTSYANRPAICRLWGVLEDMPCPHGCVPERHLTSKEGEKILEALDAIDI